MYGSRFSSAARRGKASVPIVDLVPPRGASTLSFMPCAVDMASNWPASQRCMFEKGREKCSPR